MTRTKFIMKWLGTNKPYTQQFRDEMLDDLDKVIDFVTAEAVKNRNTHPVINGLLAEVLEYAINTNRISGDRDGEAGITYENDTYENIVKDFLTT
jgi:hypothetical protein